jgi:hypothetical protein
MKKKILIFTAVIMVVAIGYVIAQNVSNYMEQGGSRWVIGGSLDVASGGDLDIESGASLKPSGTAITSTATELNALDGITSTVTELNKIDGYTGDATELNYAKALYDTGVTTTEYDALDGITSTVAELNILDGATVTFTELNLLDNAADPGVDGAWLLIPQQALADIDDASASTKWSATTDPANWSVDVGTGNSRTGGNVIELTTDAAVDDEFEMDYGAVLDISSYNYIGWWMRNDGGDIVADAFDVELRTPADTVITGCDDLDVPAMSQDDWTFVEFDISGCTSAELARFQKYVIEGDTNIAAYTAVDWGAIKVYAVSNGDGPARGRLEYWPVSSGTVTQGEIACWPEIGNETNGVETCDANDYAPAGKAVTTSTTYVLLQTSGVGIMQAGNAITDNGDVDVLAGAVTIDDAGSIENSIGYAMEGAADAGDYIYIRFEF